MSKYISASELVPVSDEGRPDCCMNCIERPYFVNLEKNCSDYEIECSLEQASTE